MSLDNIIDYLVGGFWYKESSSFPNVMFGFNVGIYIYYQIEVLDKTFTPNPLPIPILELNQTPLCFIWILVVEKDELGPCCLRRIFESLLTQITPWPLD